MRNKGLDFSQVYDVRALRVIVPEIKDCYTALGVVHNLWQPIPKEFDDYISRPKGNLYQSLHTAVVGPAAKTLEVQIRTEEMHHQAEYGIAAHWAYKEGGKGTEKARASKQFEQKIAWLRELLAWRDEVADWSKARGTRLDDTVYVLTPQGKVIDLPAGATPVDFAYALHTDLGHRCRGAKVDGRIVPLDTPLASGQRVEIVAAKSGGPSRDWLNAERGFVKSPRARQKIRQWFNAQAIQESVAAGRSQVEKELRRERAVNANLEELASRLGFKQPDDFFAAVARDNESHASRSALRTGKPRRARRAAEEEKGALRQGRRARGRNGQPAHAARPLLQAGAARSCARLRHARQRRVGAPRRLRGAEAPGREPARAADRSKLG
jgi:GTP pyrophosphokinase